MGSGLPDRGSVHYATEASEKCNNMDRTCFSRLHYFPCRIRKVTSVKGTRRYLQIKKQQILILTSLYRLDNLINVGCNVFLGKYLITKNENETHLKQHIPKIVFLN
uniref:Uncharacterized protein n=1 Tax=Cacopsylla melanoneura TaxID=428564 RepID=A0A8D8UYL2_9HEMI